ncbi:UNKNOWN [Stylonychia lemnae]|uniref:TLDc domain-containing protein n=1 Tax=Stylonychia lemnae TaxID=5949 RepID=A0A078A837_STYLE|nr:UNKNOWN [Stylonychia lemnae]|eukprot:CDW78420.1 UNKNOWN [Stylonychia lemnae]
MQQKSKPQWKSAKFALMIEFNQCGSGKQVKKIPPSDKGELLEKFLTERKFKITRINHNLNKQPGEQYLDYIENSFNEVYENAKVISRLAGESVQEDSVCVFVYVRCLGISTSSGEIEIQDPNGYRFQIEKFIKLFAMIKNCATYIYLECPRNNPSNLSATKKPLEQFNPINAVGFLLVQYCFAKESGWDYANDDKRQALLLKFIQALAANQIPDFYQYVTSWQPESNFIGKIELSTILDQAIAPINKDIEVAEQVQIVDIDEQEQLIARMKELEEENQTYYEQNMKMKEDLDERDRIITQLQDTIRELEQQADHDQVSNHSQQQVANLEEHIQTLKGNNQNLENKVQKLELKKEKLVKKLKSKKDKLKKANQELQNQQAAFSEQILQFSMNQHGLHKTPRESGNGMNSNSSQNNSRDIINPMNDHRDQRFAQYQVNNRNSLYSDPFNADDSKINDEDDQQNTLDKRQLEILQNQKKKEEEEQKSQVEEDRIKYQRFLKEQEEERQRKKKEEDEQLKILMEIKQREEREAFVKAKKQKEDFERWQREQEEQEKLRIQKELDEKKLRQQFEREQLEIQKRLKIKESEMEIKREMDLKNQMKAAQDGVNGQLYVKPHGNFNANESIDHENFFEAIKKQGSFQNNNNQMNPQNVRVNEYERQFNVNYQNYQDLAIDDDMELAKKLQDQEMEQERKDQEYALKLQLELNEQEFNQQQLINNPQINHFEEHKQPIQRQDQAQIKPIQNQNANNNKRNEMPIAKPQQQIQQNNINQDDEYVLPNCDIGFTGSQIVQTKDIDKIRQKLGKKCIFAKIYECDSGVENGQLIQQLQGKRNLLILVQAKRNNDNEVIGRFGAFISIPYMKCNDDNEQFFIDPEAFIISLDKGMIFDQIKPREENVGFSSQAILIFGKQKEGSRVPKIQSMDLFLRDSKGVKKSSSSLGSSFQIPEGIDKKEGSKILTGLLLFSIDKIEVFEAIQ